MKRVSLVAALLVALTALPAQPREAKTGAAASCPPPPAPYDGPLFDAMAQLHRKVDGNQAIETIRRARVVRLALFARIHRKGSSFDTVLALKRRNPDFILLGAPKAFDQRRDLDARFVDDVLTGVKRHGYRFIGEILYTHGDKSHGEQTPTGERYIDPLRPGTARLLEGLRPHRLPVMTHWEAYAWERDWPRFDKLYGAWPEQRFIIPHGGFASTVQIGQILARHANVVVTLSKREKDRRSYSDPDHSKRSGPGLIDRCKRVRAGWRRLLDRYPNRFLFATDAHKRKRWDSYARNVRRWRRILGQLP
jgi:hypothetical protein